MADEILFMQIRLVDLAMEKWGKTRKQVLDIFNKCNIYQFISSCYGIFHTEGDECVFEDVQELVHNRGYLNATI